MSFRYGHVDMVVVIIACLLCLCLCLPGFMKHITFTISFSCLLVKTNRSVISALSVANFQFNLPTNLNSSPKKDMNNNWLPSTIKIQSLCLCASNLSANTFPFIRVVTPLILIILNIFTKHFLGAYMQVSVNN